MTNFDPNLGDDELKSFLQKHHPATPAAPKNEFGLLLKKISERSQSHPRLWFKSVVGGASLIAASLIAFIFVTGNPVRLEQNRSNDEIVQATFENFSDNLAGFSDDSDSNDTTTTEVGEEFLAFMAD